MQAESPSDPNQDYQVSQHNYNVLGNQEIEEIGQQIFDKLSTIDGDTASIVMSARQAAIFLWVYKNLTRPNPESEIYSDILRFSR